MAIPPVEHWSPVLDREVAGDFFGKYQLVTDIFDTRGTGLEFRISDVGLFDE